MNIFACCAKTSNLDSLGLSRDQRNAVKRFWSMNFEKHPQEHFHQIFMMYLSKYPDYHEKFQFDDTIGSVAYVKNISEYSSIILNSLSSLVRMSTENIDGFTRSIEDIAESHMEREVIYT